MRYEPFQLHSPEINTVQKSTQSKNQRSPDFNSAVQESVDSTSSNMACYIYIMYALIILVFEQSFVNASKDFHIRHYCGYCIKPGDSGFVRLRPRCRFKFRWQGGVRLVASQKCLAVNGSSDGSFLLFTNQCSGVNSLFQYLPASNGIKHMQSGKCLTFKGSKPEHAKVVLGPCELSSSNRFWLLRQQMYIIRHHKSGACIRLDKVDGLFKLYPEAICDRFTGTFVHFKTGKCMVGEGYLQAMPTCPNATTAGSFIGKVIMSNDGSKCMEVDGGDKETISPGTKLLLRECGSDSKMTNFDIYDDKYTLNVKVISESCDDIAVRGKCRYARGHVFVNGYQFVSGRGANYAGIHIVLFDYLSGIFEHSQVFSILSNAAQQDALAAYLNNMPEGKILFMAARDAVSINDNLALALQKRGVSATFATTKLPKNRCSMAAVVYTGKERKSWEISVSNANCQGASIIDTKIHPFHDLQGNNDCSQEMGLRTGQLPDSRFTAASKWDVGDNFAPHQARLHNGGGSIRGWCTMNNAPVSEYLQIDFGVVQLFTGIALQGQDTTDTHCVVKFVLGYSIDGVRWETYKEDQIEKEFGGPTTMMGDILVSRFNRILARFIRVIPKQRSYSTVHCIRMEMFGCAPASPIFDDKAYTARDTYEIGNVANGQISFYAYAPISKQVTVEMSSAKHRNNLAKNTAQSHYRKVNVTTKYENGTVLSEKVGRVAILKDEKTNVKSAARIIYDLPESGFCNFDVGFTSAVLDCGTNSSEPTWNTYTYETDEGLTIVSKPFTKIMRGTTDQGQLIVNASMTQKEVFSNGDRIIVNVSISQKAKVEANAYNFQLNIYYNKQFLKLISSTADQGEEFSILPSRNISKVGMLYFQTDVFSLFSRQAIQIEFEATEPYEFISRKEKVENILLNYVYHSNLAKFNGQVMTNVSQRLAYKQAYRHGLPVDEKKAVKPRLSLPEVSIIHDSDNSRLFICVNKQHQGAQNSPTCYYTQGGEIAWQPIPEIAAVVGIDASRNILFGIDMKGIAYVQASSPFLTFKQIIDEEWISVASQPLFMAAKMAIVLTSFPLDPSPPWIFSASGKEVWALTKQGLMKNGDKGWTRVLSW